MYSSELPPIRKAASYIGSFEGWAVYAQVYSYKYADTDIHVSSGFNDDSLFITVTDFGSGVSADELALLFSKFYRGKNAENQSGYGLGLYISKYLMTHMHGDLFCENTDGGFCIKVILKLA